MHLMRDDRPGLRFNFPVPTEDEMGESESDEEDDLGVSSADLPPSSDT